VYVCAALVCPASSVATWGAASGAAGAYRSLSISAAPVWDTGASFLFVGSDASQLLNTNTGPRLLCPFFLSGADGGTYSQQACITEQTLGIRRGSAMSSSADGLLVAVGGIDTPWSSYRNAGTVAVMGRSSRNSSDWALLQDLVPSMASFAGLRADQYMWFGVSQARMLGARGECG
jgi:hypothetical protein